MSCVKNGGNRYNVKEAVEPEQSTTKHCIQWHNLFFSKTCMKTVKELHTKVNHWDCPTQNFEIQREKLRKLQGHTKITQTL